MQTVRYAIPLLLTALIVVGCGAPEPAPTAPADAQETTTNGNGPPQPDPAAVAECRTRTAPSGEILVRERYPSGAVDVMHLGDGWVWNYRDNLCQTGADFAIAGATMVPGDCVWVARWDDNPDYDVEARPVRPLKKIFASGGMGC